MLRNLQKKKKIEDERCTFNTEWTYKYFFTNFGNKAVCLICQEIVAVYKEYNLKTYFQTKHGNFGSNLSESKLQQKANDMVKSLKQQQTVFVKQTGIQEAATTASFVLAYKLAKHNKPFTDAEFVKEYSLMLLILHAQKS